MKKRLAMKCTYCGEPGKVFCRCGRPTCPRHTFYYTDESNEAITDTAPAKCIYEMPVKTPRPLTWLAAIANQEWWADA